jgi:hypothetical protein
VVDRPRLFTIAGVPVSLVFDFAVGGYCIGLPINHERVDRQKLMVGNPQKTVVTQFKVGNMKFITFSESPYNEDHRLHLSTSHWTCEVKMRQVAGNGFVFWDKYYAVHDYTVTDEQGWLRDMTIARMLSDEWME